MSARPGPRRATDSTSLRVRVSATLSGSLKAGSLCDSEAGAAGTGPPRAYWARPSDGPRFVRGRGRSRPPSPIPIGGSAPSGCSDPGARACASIPKPGSGASNWPRPAGVPVAEHLPPPSQRACPWRPWARPELEKVYEVAMTRKGNGQSLCTAAHAGPGGLPLAAHRGLRCHGHLAARPRRARRAPWSDEARMGTPMRDLRT